MDVFAEAFERTVGVEGGYSDHPADRGGPTKYGVTERVARAFGYQGDMRDLPLPFAQMIFREQYWQPLNLARVAELSRPIALEVFDTGVNMGVGAAARFLQRALWCSGGVDVKVDGHLGPVSLAALRVFLSARQGGGERVLLRILNGLQLAGYVEIVERDPSQRVFFYGWVQQRVS